MVAKAFDMVDQLLKNIDVTYSKSDDVGDSEVVSKVVESVLKEENDSTKNDESESQVEDEDEDEESFHKKNLKNLKFETNANDDPIILAYHMVGSDKLFSDVEFRFKM
ncbi:hypothetical protein Hanom_Chr07g00625621 [Helianthus anomalus]